MTYPQPEEQIGAMNSPENNPTALNQQDKESMDDLSEQQSETQAHIDKLCRHIKILEENNRDGQKLWEEAQLRIEQLQRELAEARREIADLRAQVRELSTGETD